MDDLQKQLLCLFAIIGAVSYGAIVLAEVLNKDKEDAKKRADFETARVIGYNGRAVLLDMNDDERDVEAHCSLGSDEDISKEDMHLIFPKGTTRTVWEWKRMGDFSRNLNK